MFLAVSNFQVTGDQSPGTAIDFDTFVLRNDESYSLVDSGKGIRLPSTAQVMVALELKITSHVSNPSGKTFRAMWTDRANGATPVGEPPIAGVVGSSGQYSGSGFDAFDMGAQFDLGVSVFIGQQGNTYEVHYSLTIVEWSALN